MFLIDDSYDVAMAKLEVITDKIAPPQEGLTRADLAHAVAVLQNVQPRLNIRLLRHDLTESLFFVVS